MPSATNDPTCKMRLAATRLLLPLAPHMRDSDALRQAALLKSQDKAKEVRRVGLLLLAALLLLVVYPPPHSGASPPHRCAVSVCCCWPHC